MTEHTYLEPRVEHNAEVACIRGFDGRPNYWQAICDCGWEGAWEDLYGVADDARWDHEYHGARW